MDRSKSLEGDDHTNQGGMPPHQQVDAKSLHGRAMLFNRDTEFFAVEM